MYDNSLVHVHVLKFSALYMYIYTVIECTCTCTYMYIYSINPITILNHLKYANVPVYSDLITEMLQV